MSGRVEAVSQASSHRFSKKPRLWITLLAGLGVEGDAHLGTTVKHRSRVARDPTQPNLRQVHLLHSELLDDASTVACEGLELARDTHDFVYQASFLRRLGVVRVSTKYPRIATEHMTQTGRQAEIVEVHGSVELAPLAGLAEAIVDLTATGTTLRENNLVIREEIAVCTARLIANPVSHKLKAGAIDELLGHLRTSV